MFLTWQVVHFQVTHPDTNPAKQRLTSVQICHKHKQVCWKRV